MPSLTNLFPLVFLPRTWLIVLVVAATAFVAYCIARQTGWIDRHKRKRNR